MRDRAWAAVRVAGVTCAFVLVGWAPGAGAQTSGADTSSDYTPPVVSVNPPVIVPGGPVIVTGNGCPPGTVPITMSGQPLGKATADQSGRFSFSGTAPDLAPGVQTITAVTCASTQITVRSAQAPSVALPGTGSSLTVPLARTGAGLVACGAVGLALGRRRARSGSRR